MGKLLLPSTRRDELNNAIRGRGALANSSRASVRCGGNSEEQAPLDKQTLRLTVRLGGLLVAGIAALSAIEHLFH
jgi:hypothetical protein